MIDTLIFIFEFPSCSDKESKRRNKKFLTLNFIKTMVRKRVKRKATAASSASGTGVVDNIEKSSMQVYNKDFNNIATLTPDQEISYNDIDVFLEEHVQSISDNPTSDKISMNNKLGSNMLGSKNATRRTKDVRSTSTNGAQPKSVHDQNNETIAILDDDVDPEHLTLWQHPITTLHYFMKELLIDCLSFTKKTFEYKRIVFSIGSLITLFFVLGRLAGPQQEIFKAWEAQVRWWLYWIGLGVLSSVGLGTGLHTFVLYLGPHIAAVTMAAYECGALNFPEPPYPDQIVCPTTVDTAWTVGILNIMKKVRVEAMMWGAGTALGELPPYFMARAARTFM